MIKYDNLLEYGHQMVLRLQKKNPLTMCYFFPINPNELEVVFVEGTFKFKIRECKLNLPVIFESGCDACIWNFQFYPDKKIPHFAPGHKCEGDVTVAKAYIAKFVAKRLIVAKKNICIVCRKRGYFNYKGNNFGIYCSFHRLPNMPDIKRPLCQEKKCITRASCGGTKQKPLYCSKHANGEKNNISKKCEFEKCEITPIFGFEGGECRFCSKHKLEGMLNIRDKKCKFESCKTQPIYGFKDEGVKFCAKHRLEGMINMRSKKCEFEKCEVLASFGSQWQKHTRCLKHKLEGMSIVRSKKCEFYNCNIQPCYGFRENKARFCNKHKLEGMIDVKSKKCITYLCDLRTNNNKYEGYCFRCFCLTFPEKPNARNYKTKEVATAEFIKNKFPNLNWICDKQSGASGKRPDLLCDLGHQIIIIEIDENQHLPYYKKDNGDYCSCENKRMMQISQDFNHKPIIFIRFNPDKYTCSSLLQNNNEESLYEKENDREQKKISGCWRLNANGLCVIADQKKWEERLNVLTNSVLYWINNKTEKIVLEIFLYYDGFD